MKKLIFPQVLICLILGCKNPAAEPANNPPNPPLVSDVIYSVPYGATLSLTVPFSNPRDPDVGDIVSMIIVESKMTDSSGNIAGDVPADLLSNADPRFTDSFAGDFSINGLAPGLLEYALDYMGVIIQCVDQSGEGSTVSMIRFRFGGT